MSDIPKNNTAPEVPAAESSELPVSPVPPQGAVPSEPALPERADPYRLLIVDDDADFREIMSVKFKSAGFGVATASSGKEAIGILTQATVMPDLILMDINMPGETGTDVALAIKQDPKTKDMHIAFLTSLKEPWPAIAGAREKVAKELGMDDFLEKTDDLDNLVKKVKAILARQTGG